jgi:hypothetical protein
MIGNSPLHLPWRIEVEQCHQLQTRSDPAVIEVRLRLSELHCRPLPQSVLVVFALQDLTLHR